MFSENGRLHKNKEAANVDDKNSYVVVCADCGYSMTDKKKEFGEDACCNKCGSKNLTTKLGK